MPPKSTASTPLMSSLTRIGGVVIPIVIAVFLVFNQANFLIGRALLIAFGDNESRYKSASLEWDGDVVAKDFVLYPYDDEDETTTIRFEQVHLETPGWFWFLRNTFDRKLKRAKLERLHLTLTGGSSAAGIDPSLGDLGPFGAISASPFEAEGCMQDGMWIRDELVEMGLNPEPTTLEFDFRTEAGQLLTTVVLETKGASRVQLDRRGNLPGRDNMLFLDTYADETTSETWEVQDQGFVAARNRFCAKKDKVEPLRFVDRHVESVVRLMDTFGIAVDAEARSIYRRFARDGGKLTYQIAYPKALPAEFLYELRAHNDVIGTSRASLDHNDRTATLRWDRFDPVPLPGLDDGEPTYAALLKERAEAIKGGASAIAGGVVPPQASVATDSAATTSTATATESIDALIAARVAAANAAKTPAAVATDADAAQAPDTATSAEPIAASESANPETPVASIAPRRGSQLQWTDLTAMQGRLVRIWTVHNPPRTVEILGANAGELRVGARLGGGNAEYTIQRSAFLRATFVQ